MLKDSDRRSQELGSRAGRNGRWKFDTHAPHSPPSSGRSFLLLHVEVKMQGGCKEGLPLPCIYRPIPVLCHSSSHRILSNDPLSIDISSLRSTLLSESPFGQPSHSKDPNPPSLEIAMLDTNAGTFQIVAKSKID
uniref:Uncharacterized protein n=1 Tax=Sphaerodactylus townsendi TaxID=933632 RepID=A0ACB8EGB6_9SAUR